MIDTVIIVVSIKQERNIFVFQVLKVFTQKCELIWISSIRTTKKKLVLIGPLTQ